MSGENIDTLWQVALLVTRVPPVVNITPLPHKYPYIYKRHYDFFNYGGR